MSELPQGGIVGIDPGKSGGFAYVCGADAGAWKMPATTLGITSMAKWLCEKEIRGLFLEHVHAMPGQGVTSMFNFGKNFGELCAAIAAAYGKEATLVRPMAWQKATCGLTKGDKNVSKRYAQRLYPDIKMTHAIADALLIATYGQETLG